MEMRDLVEDRLISPDRLARHLKTTKREIGETLGIAPESSIAAATHRIRFGADVLAASDRDPEHRCTGCRELAHGLCLVSVRAHRGVWWAHT